MKTIEFTTYSHLAPALINDDTSNLSNDDMILFDKIREWLADNESTGAVSCSDESYFSWNPDWGMLGGDCLDYVALVHD